MPGAASVSPVHSSTNEKLLQNVIAKFPLALLPPSFTLENHLKRGILSADPYDSPFPYFDVHLFLPRFRFFLSLSLPIFLSLSFCPCKDEFIKVLQSDTLKRSLKLYLDMRMHRLNLFDWEFFFFCFSTRIREIVHFNGGICARGGLRRIFRLILFQRWSDLISRFFTLTGGNNLFRILLKRFFSALYEK